MTLCVNRTSLAKQQGEGDTGNVRSRVDGLTIGASSRPHLKISHAVSAKREMHTFERARSRFGRDFGHLVNCKFGVGAICVAHADWRKLRNRVHALACKLATLYSNLQQANCTHTMQALADSEIGVKAYINFRVWK